MSEYSVEEIRIEAGIFHELSPTKKMLTAYADLREQIERAREGVTDAVVQKFIGAFARNKGLRLLFKEDLEDCRAALQAVAHLLPSGERKEGDATKGRIDFTGMWNAMSDQVTANQPARAAQVEHDPTLKYEAALAELIEAVDPAIESGDILADAHAAALVALQHREPVAQGEADQTTPFNEWWDAHRTAYAVNGSMKGLAIMAWQASRTFYAAQPASPERPAGRQGEFNKVFAKHQPCGCVVCTCEDDEQCHGCGATHCGTHPVGEMPNPIYTHPTAPVGVPDGDDWAQLKKATEDWADGVDTEVPQHTLMRLAELGLLVAEQFEITKKGMDGLAAAPSVPQGEG
jgi:soluble cytochrome b562